VLARALACQGSRVLTLLGGLGAALVIAVGLHPSLANSHSAPVPSFSHVIIIVEENREASHILGNTAAPYVNQLATQYSLARQYYGVSHPSLPNYLAMVAGDTFGIDSDCSGCFVNQPSIADQIEASGRSWRAYQEDMPSPCFVGSAGNYAQEHNPFIYFDSIRTNKARCAASIVPFDQLAADLAQGQLPDYAFITPNLCDDGHDCRINTTDTWLAGVVPSILASESFQDGGVLIITWDEGETDAGCCGGLAQGGQSVAIILSPLARTGFASDVPASHYSLLRTIEDAWGLPPLGHAADVSPLAEYFGHGS
jgi:phosphatidylinositol-3-phosphatase